jgi:hypothetical protein
MFMHCSKQAGRGTLTCSVRRTCDVEACSRALYQYLGGSGLLLQYRAKDGRRRNSYVRHKLELEPLPGWLRINYEAHKLEVLVKVMCEFHALAKLGRERRTTQWLSVFVCVWQPTPRPGASRGARAPCSGTRHTGTL